MLWGTNVANNQPVFMKYLYLARKRGARVVVVNPYLEPGLERYWVPSNAESALFGTKLCDLHVPVRPGATSPSPTPCCKRLIERGAVDGAFIAAHTEGWDELEAAPRRALDRTSCSSEAGVDAEHVRGASSTSTPRAARPCWCGAWASPSTATASTACGRSSTSAWPAATSAATAPGSMPIRGHSGVQGGAEMGAYATALPGGAAGRRRARRARGRAVGLRRARPTPG